MIEPTGYTALDLIGFTDRGAYDPTANYVKNDIVTVGNTKWRCKIDDTTGVTPAENANWTIYLESATSLAGMDDVNITTPTNGDRLGYNSTSQKWENIKGVLYFTGVACSAMTGNFASKSDANITADFVVADITFSKPEAITTDVTWTTASGSLTLNGTCIDATCTASVTLIKKDN